MANKKQKKEFWYVLVLSDEGPVFVTGEGEHHTALWDKNEKPMEMDENYAKKMSFGLLINFHQGFAIKVSGSGNGLKRRRRMTLKDKLDSLDANKDVYIGSKSAYFFMGTPTEFYEALPELNKKWKEHFKRTVTSTESKLKQHNKVKPKPDTSEVKRVWEDGRSVVRRLEYPALMKRWETKLEGIKTNLSWHKKVLSEFTNFEDRKVKRVYRNMDNTATIIIINGYESARFWFKSEWDNRFNDKTKSKLIDDTEGDTDEE